MCEALGQWQAKCLALGARQGAHGKTVCTRSVFKTKALPNTGAVGVGDRWAIGGRSAVIPRLAAALPGSAGRLAPPVAAATERGPPGTAATERGPPGVAATGSPGRLAPPCVRA